ncbi:MAG: DNA-processing protein DprA [Acidimicrobiia bacterium]|nr:DNA-processing protein DprA [Acidimicrobiia bacterium]
MTRNDDDQRRLDALVVMASLEGITPARLRTLATLGDPTAVVDRLARRRLHHGALPRGAVEQWAGQAVDLRRRSLVDEYRAAGVQVVEVAADPRWGAALATLEDPPVVLFCRGEVTALEHRRVAVVGTRAATAYGREVAGSLGRDLAGEGVAVVSGLAKGIDAAAHRGAMVAHHGDGGSAGPPVAVVANGLDIGYPADSRRLQVDIGRCGLLLSEHPLGRRPAPWQFLARNRIIAALAEVVVVVESHERGGALSTAERAAAAGRTVMAVPGPVRSAASAGANALLADGAEVCRHAHDVFVALGLTTSAAAAAADAAVGAPGDLSSTGRVVLDALGWEPATLDQLVLRSALPLATVAVAVEELLSCGAVATSGGFYERAAP